VSEDGNPLHYSGAEIAESTGWDTPVPLSAAAGLPSFPVGIYPGWLADEVTALAEFTQTPVDLPGTIALSVLAAAVGGRAVAEIRGSWSEPLNLYVVTVLPPGTRKSAVHAELTAPLLHAEQQMAADASARIAEARTQRGVADRATEKAIAEAARKNTPEATAEAIAAAHLAEAITVPVMPRVVADDVTPEAAASLLAEQGSRLAILSAEGGCFATLAGRYSSQPNLEVFLKGHAGDMLRVDRKGRQPEHIRRPALTLGLTVQPDVLKAIADMPGFRGRGLLARILYSLPASTVGHRKIRTDPVAEETAAAYDMNVRALVHTFAEWTDPAIIPAHSRSGRAAARGRRNP
jgi:replicative DNA helicase